MARGDAGAGGASRALRATIGAELSGTVESRPTMIHASRASRSVSRASSGSRLPSRLAAAIKSGGASRPRRAAKATLAPGKSTRALRNSSVPNPSASVSSLPAVGELHLRLRTAGVNYAKVGRLIDKLGHQGGLADTGFATYDQDAAVTFPRAAEQPRLASAAHDACREGVWAQHARAWQPS